VAIASFAVVLRMPGPGALPMVLETKKAVPLNEPFVSDQFVTLAIPDVGTLKLEPHAVVRFADLRRLTLESGKLFADILPSGRGFEIRTAESAVRVHGTRFGVTFPDTVYVVEGRVGVSAAGRSLELGPGEASVGAARTPTGADAFLAWLAPYERPTMRLRLDPQGRTAITPGAPLRWNFILETDALVPLYLGDLRDISQYLSLKVNGHLVGLDPTRAEVRARRSANGLVRLDVSHPCVIEGAIDPGVFREPGKATVRAVFTSGTDAPEKTWVGVVESEPVFVEVR
jgi:hypothetical protein